MDGMWRERFKERDHYTRTVEQTSACSGCTPPCLMVLGGDH